MALVGSALGNSVIFRTGNTFDPFTESTLKKLALGSHKLKNLSIEQFFGGSLLFSPKDVNPTDKNKLKDEIDQKIENSVKKWSYLKAGIVTSILPMPKIFMQNGVTVSDY